VLGYGLLNCETPGISNKLHENDSFSSLALPIRFINIIFNTEQINTPEIKTKPFKFWLNNDDINKKNIKSVGDISEKNCNTLDNVNAIAIIYYIIDI